MADDPAGAQALVGRRSELADLSAAVGLASSSGISGVLLGGDAGIGKTRLLRTLAHDAAAAGQLVMVGHCLDLGDSGLPFQPFTGAFGAVAPDLRARLVAELPSLGVLLPGGSGAEAVERGALFAAVAAALQVLAEDRPVLLIVEDAHWADASTRHLLRYLLAQPGERPVHMVISYRADDLHRRHPLREALAEWNRLPGVRRIELAPLGDTEVAELVQARAGGSMGSAALGAVVERARGNAFFAEELLDAGLADHAAPLPETLADLLLLRLDRLDDRARSLVQVAAVADGSEGWEALAEVSGLATAELDLAVRAAVDHKVLRRVDGETYEFRHALLGEAVRDDLLPGERRQIHAAFLAALPADAPAATLARHAGAVGQRTTAFEATVRAAQDAARLAGHDEAAQHYERALDLIDAAPADLDRIGLVVAASNALTTSGQLDRSLRLLQGHLGSATGRDVVRLTVAIGNTHYLIGDDTAAVEIAAEARRLIGDESSVLAAEVAALVARATAAIGHERLDEAIQAAEKAVALAEEVGSSDVVLDARSTLTRLLVRAGHDTGEAQRDFGQLIEAARASDDVFGELRGLHQLAFLHHNAGELDLASTYFEAGMRRAEATGWAWGPYGFDGRFFSAVIGYELGRWDDVIELCRTPVGAPEFAVAALASVQLLVEAGRGDQAALARTQHLHPWWRRDVVSAIHSGTATVDLLGQGGDLAGARRAHDDLVALQSDTWDDPLFPARIRLAALLAGQVVAVAAGVERAGRSDLLELLSTLESDVEAVVGHHPSLGPEGQAWRLRASAEIASGRHLLGADVEAKEWVAAWRRTLQAFEGLKDPYETARSATRLAAALVAVGDHDEVAHLLEQARTTAVRLGAHPLVREIDAVTVMRAASSALTGREHEVLQLVAQGLSNGAIGKRLFISTKTVSVHVSNILAKLGASARTEAAAIARREGLIDGS